MNRKILRILSQFLVLSIVLMLPIFNVLRFDINTTELYLLGQAWSFSTSGGGYISGSSTLNHGNSSLNFLIKGVLPWFLFLLSFPIWGAILGRFFCGWLCPVSTIMEWGDALIKQIKRTLKYFSASSDRDFKDLFYGLLSGLISLITLIFISIIFSGFFIAPRDIFRQIITLNLTSNLIFTTLGMAGLVVATVLFAKRLLCNYVCIFGLVQMLAAIVSPISMRVRFDRKNGKNCTNCRGCENACLMGLKPRTLIKMSTSCINCGECMTACEKELGVGMKLFHYRFGKGNPLRGTAP
ncbi:MAG: 4Fe-4S binding protein [Nitrospirae bacterium]|nr:4Fe-4S binding protein [Nitrospirota bacterium]MBF0541154.1 4Fe-4S binding protein [Nitrospirota bacterium]